MSLTRLWLRVAPSGAIEWLCRDGQGRLLHGPGHCIDGTPPAWPRVDDTVVVWADQSLVLRRAAMPVPVVPSGAPVWPISPKTGLPAMLPTCMWWHRSR
ncbi:MAG: hypothetical protein IPO66_18265 [Rhodanobacteraceae bacterium]|nr:hypothetical protein [Rhodanobacteraceae bacterium]